MADFTPTPLLYSERSVWNWEPSEHVDDYGAVEIVEPYLMEWIDESLNDNPIPKHPLHRQLAYNVYSSSVSALETILNPSSIYPREGFLYDDLPIVLRQAGDPKEMQSTDSFTTTKSRPFRQNESTSGYLFRRSGNTWEVQFKSGEKTERGVFTHAKGFQHYLLLLMAPTKEISCIEMDPREVEFNQRSSTSLDEYLADSGDPDTFTGVRGPDEVRDKLWNDDQLKYFAEEVSSLEQQIEYETDAAEKKKLQLSLKEYRKYLNQRRRMLEGDTNSGRAFNRVKKAMKDCRDKLDDHGLPQLAEHLRLSVSRVGHGFRYDPRPLVSWEFV